VLLHIQSYNLTTCFDAWIKINDMVFYIQFLAYKVLPPFQIKGCFGFSRYIVFTCSSAAPSAELWQHLGIQWNLISDLFQMLIQAKQQFPNPYFMEIFTIVAWQIWKQRNNFIFDRGHASLDSWKFSFSEEARLQAHRICDATVGASPAVLFSKKKKKFLLCT